MAEFRKIASEIFCLKSKDIVLVAVNLLISFFCKSANEMVEIGARVL